MTKPRSIPAIRRDLAAKHAAQLEAEIGTHVRRAMEARVVEMQRAQAALRTAFTCPRDQAWWRTRRTTRS